MPPLKEAARSAGRVSFNR